MREKINGVTVGGLRKTVTKIVLIFMTLMGGQLIFGTPVFGVTDASISISISAPLSVTLDPGVLGTSSQSISITTDNYTGYAATLNNSTNSTDLVNVNNSSLTIPTISLPQGSSSITTNQFVNGYGLSTNGTNYVPAPTSSSNIPLGDRSTAGTSSHTLYLAVLPSMGTAAGTYTKSFVVTAVVNNPQYSVTFNANAGTDTVNNMPSNISTTTSSTGTITLPSNSPTRSGYTFSGWDENSSATTATYTPGDNIALEPTQANTISLYAIWSQSGGGGSGTPDDPYIDDTTTNYDPSTQTPNTTVLYEAISGQPQVTVDNNGNVTSFEFTDTTGVSIDDAAIDTGYIPFDGSKQFEIYIKAQFPPSLNNNNGSTSTALGILLDVRNRSTNSGNNLQITYSKNATSPKAVVNNQDNTLGLTNISGLGNYIFEATITYNGTNTLTIVYNKNGTMTTKTISKTINVANQTIYLGYTVNTSGNVIRQAQGTTVYEFYVRDL